MRALVVNLYGGPGTGKSTMAAALFAELKWRGLRAELVTEFAKGVVWEGRPMPDPFYVSAKQCHTLKRAARAVDIVVTDSPLLLGLIYGRPETAALDGAIREAYAQFSNLDIFLRRANPYADYGRLQNESEALALDRRCTDMLTQQAILLYWYRASKVEVSPIITRILEEVACRENH